MKKTITFLLILIMFIVIIPVSAEEKSFNNNGFPVTHEPSMPYYDDDIDDYGKLMSSRNKWLDEIIEYNEKLYG